MNNSLHKKEVEQLFYASLINANSLWEVACNNLNSKQKHISLGLAEIALEEIGKSFTCLAYYNSNDCWNSFWKEWKNHKKKAIRSFNYEYFTPIRLEIPNAKEYFPSKRYFIPLEKEVSFYVDFDLNNRNIVNPWDEVNFEEVYNRVTTVFGPLHAGARIAEKFKAGTNQYKNAFSDYARFTMNNYVLQQDALKILENMKNEQQEYNKALTDISNVFQTQVKTTEDIFALP